MFDFHRHFTQSKPTENAFYATSSLDEWSKEAKFMSLGVLANNINISLKDYESFLKRKLQENSSFHVGEVGLDNRFNNINKQILFFESSLKLAAKYSRIFTIHIVNENDNLIKVLQQNKNNLPEYIIYHGYNKSVELAQQLKEFNVTVSINPSVLKTKLFKNIKDLDKVGFLVESDWDKETDGDYFSYFNSFIKTLNLSGATSYKDINNEFRAILENF